MGGALGQVAAALMVGAAADAPVLLTKLVPSLSEEAAAAAAVEAVEEEVTMKGRLKALHTWWIGRERRRTRMRKRRKRRRRTREP